MDRQPALAARIQEAAREKLGHALDAQDGDLVSRRSVISFYRIANSTGGLWVDSVEKVILGWRA
jgi:hypothetical protein